MAEAPVLYSFRRCPYAMRARLALLVSETACTVREVKLADKPLALIAASPKATVPVLVLAGGRVIDQSLDIMRWALARHDPADWLAGDDTALIAANDGAFKHHLDRYKYPERHAGEGGGDPPAHRAVGLAWLATLDERIAAGGFLCGARRTLADAAIMPFVRQFTQVDRAWFDAQPLPALHRWLAGELATPLFARAMRPRAPWREGDPPDML
ncbi:glutathione S-transferase [Sphingomonas solaris]|uniref:Glutathione S-transferase n=1 Tax=Alterirhizorhabdus solaris TaxID=2529389 RepID=A0A558QTW8_9SPHN|nr:glutathione S-transferase [Sphingomonas solaris]TVV70575.1 glutathione S-transferase [Sphingomonas solaris]